MRNLMSSERWNWLARRRCGVLAGCAAVLLASQALASPQESSAQGTVVGPAHNGSTSSLPMQGSGTYLRVVVVKNQSGMVVQPLYIDNTAGTRTPGANVTLGMSQTHDLNGDHAIFVQVFYWKTMNVGSASGSGWSAIDNCYFTLPAHASGTTNLTVSGLLGAGKCTLQ
jgi:hypothetical protein